MTVILDDQSNDPGTHVLLIGVGDYPFLKDGSAPPQNAFDLHMDLGQLPSPPISLSEVATWFCDDQHGFHNPPRPLRSLQVLASAATPLEWVHPNEAKHTIQRATMANVQQAINDWKSRADRNPENLCVLYFCGHGLSFGESQNSLLMEDFGRNQNNPMQGAIAIDKLHLGMRVQCQAKYQCYFVDACRNSPSNAFITRFGTETGDQVIAGGLSKNIRDKAAPIFFATQLAAAAYGFADQPSLFTQGLLRCFRGVGSRDADDHWEVTVAAVAEGVNKCVESLAFQTQPQFCQPRDTGVSFMLHRLRADPEVVVKVFMRDAQLLPTTMLVHVCETTNEEDSREPLNMPWWLPVRLGHHRFKAIAKPGDQLINERTRFVAPPSAEVGL